MHPNLFVIGAPKSGTTTLASLLCQHPDILVSTPKETCFHFSEYERGCEYYKENFFPGFAGQKIVCDFSILNMAYSDISARRMHADFPSARLLALLRNPIDRAFSDYRESVRAGLKFRPFEKTLDIEQNRKSSDTNKIIQYQYFSRGLYADQLENYLEFYERGKILVLTYEKFYASLSCELRNIYRFLGIDDLVEMDTAIRRNVGEGNVRSMLAQRLLRGDHTFGGLVKSLFPGKSRRALSDLARNLKHMNLKPEKKASIEPLFRQKLAEYYAISNRRLRQLFDIDLGQWDEY